MTKQDKPIIAYKGFDADFKCRDFQYEIGKTYEHNGDVVACRSGFHACEHPLDVFGYYPPASSKFALVELAGETSHEEDRDTKIAAAKITIKAELQIPEIVDAAIKHVFSAAKCLKKSTATGNWGAASATGDQGAASATGDQGAAMASGYEGKASAANGNAIFLCERNENYEIVAVWAGIAGKNGIKPDVFYVLRDGEPVESA